MGLVSANDEHLAQVMGWFKDAQSTKEWAGPQFPYPFDRILFKDSLSLGKKASYVLSNEDGMCIAFGQVSKRGGYCHLSLLAVAPEHRGTGIASTLINSLVKCGLELTNAKSASLFVVTHNTRAIRAYEKVGFKISVYPGKIPYDDCLFMTKSM
jgi:ribosomal protein S18 acetylase RimI-like enzyme